MKNLIFIAASMLAASQNIMCNQDILAVSNDGKTLVSTSTKTWTSSNVFHEMIKQVLLKQKLTFEGYKTSAGKELIELYLDEQRALEYSDSAKEVYRLPEIRNLTKRMISQMPRTDAKNLNILTSKEQKNTLNNLFKCKIINQI